MKNKFKLSIVILYLTTPIIIYFFLNYFIISILNNELGIKNKIIYIIILFWLSTIIYDLIKISKLRIKTEINIIISLVVATIIAKNIIKINFISSIIILFINFIICTIGINILKKTPK